MSCDKLDTVFAGQWETQVFKLLLRFKDLHTYLAQTPEIGQGLGRFLSCGARKQEQT